MKKEIHRRTHPLRVSTENVHYAVESWLKAIKSINDNEIIRMIEYDKNTRTYIIRLNREGRLDAH